MVSKTEALRKQEQGQEVVDDNFPIWLKVMIVIILTVVIILAIGVGIRNE